MYMPSWTSKSQVLTPRRLAQCPFACLGNPEIFCLEGGCSSADPTKNFWVNCNENMIFTRSILHGYKLILTSLLVLMGISTWIQTNPTATSLLVLILINGNIYVHQLPELGPFFAGALWLIGIGDRGNSWWVYAEMTSESDLTENMFFF